MPKRVQTASWTEAQWGEERAKCRDRAKRTSFHIYKNDGQLLCIYKKRASAIVFCNDNDDTHYVKVVKEVAE